MHQIVLMKNKIFNMLFTNSINFNKVVNEAYTQTIKNILEMDARFYLTAQEVKNCFAKYSNDIMKASNTRIIAEIKKNSNDKGDKLNYVEPFLQILKDNHRVSRTV